VLLRYARQDARGWATVFVVTLLSTGASLLTPWPTKVLVDQVLGDRPRSGLTAVLPGADTGAGLLGYVVAATLLLFALASALDVALTFLWVRIGQGMVWRHSGDVFAAVHRRALAFHQGHDVGDTMQRITGDCWAVHTVVDALLFSPLHHLLLFTGMVVLLWRLDPELTAVALAVVPVVTWASLVLGGRVRRAGEVRRVVLGQLQALVHQSLSGLTVVQAFGQEDRVHARFVDLSTRAVAAGRRTALVGSLDELLVGLVTTGGRGVVLLLGASRVLSGELSVGSLLVFLAYLGTLQATLSSFAGLYVALQDVRPQIDRVVEVLDGPPELVDGPRVLEGRAVGHVALDGVVFGHEPGRPVLRGVSFEARPGELTALVGATGAGKSTISGLVVRFFDPDRGRVTLDGLDLRDLRVDSVRAQVALVSQESFLFPVSIADNIAYGRPGASRQEVVAAARTAEAHEFITGLPDGYDTVVGVRGATLSGGQRQRVAIARAVLQDAPVLLLDEPTSGLDAQTEVSLLGSLDRLTAGRTTIVIAHRLSTIRKADRIVVLGDGRVVEVGTHDELRAAGGRYATMLRLQEDDAAAVTARTRSAPSPSTDPAPPLRPVPDLRDLGSPSLEPAGAGRG
jgi:ATP-binding cassette subfamily B protein/subfamily B ATP-binding cassette protein MsbA